MAEEITDSDSRRSAMDALRDARLRRKSGMRWPEIPWVGADDGLSLLTPRMLQIVWLLGLGLEREEVGWVLGRCPKTVDAHLTDIRAWLGLRSRKAVALWAVCVPGLERLRREAVRLRDEESYPMLLDRLPPGVRAAAGQAEAPNGSP